MDRPPPSTHRIVTGADGVPVLVKRATQGGARARLRTEATVLEALAHPGVVQVVAVEDDDDAFELHLAWVGSHSLATVAGLAPAAAAEVVATVSATVADVHAVGLVHRRLEPGHVLLGPGGRPVLTGFAEATGAGPAERADDVAALGALLTDLVAPGPAAIDLPERRRDPWVDRWWPGASRRDRGLRGALLTLADQAQADDLGTRPSAAELAALLRATAGLDSRVPSTRPRSSEPVEPTAASRPLLPSHPTGPVDPRSDPAPAPAPRPLLRRHRTGPVAPGSEWAATSAYRPPRSRAWAEGPGTGVRRRRPAAVALGLCLGLTAVAALTVARSDPGRPAGDPAAWARASVPTSAAASSSAPAPDQVSPSAPPSPALTTAGSTPAPSTLPVPTSPTGPSCPPVGAGGHDIDGDGCPEAVAVAGERVSVGDTTWLVGRSGDRVVVGDWDCDGIATVAVLRPSTGEVFVYDRWAGPDDEVTVGPVARVEEAVDIVAIDGVDGDGGGGSDGVGCPTLALATAGGGQVPVPFPVGSP